MRQSGAPITVYASRWKLLGLGMVWALPTYVIVRALHDVPMIALLLPVFGYAVLFALYRMVVHTPVLIIDDEGVMHNVLGVRPQRLAWSEISALGLYKRKVQPYGFPTIRYLVIELKDPVAFLSKQPSVLRVLLRWYMNSAFAPVMIPQHILPVSVDSIIQQMRTRFAPQLQHCRVWRGDEPWNV